MLTSLTDGTNPRRDRVRCPRAGVAPRDRSL